MPLLLPLLLLLLLLPLQVEATKFTEVGYHGRDVDSIVRDVEVSINVVKQRCREGGCRAGEGSAISLPASAAFGLASAHVNAAAGAASAAWQCCCHPCCCYCCLRPVTAWTSCQVTMNASSA